MIFLTKCMNAIFDPGENGKKMKVAVFFSGGASSFKAMLDDPNHGKLYDVVVGITNKPDAKGRQLFDKQGIEVLDYPLKFKPFDTEAAMPMYEEVLRGLEPFEPDIIALSGFMRLVTYPVIEHEDKAGEYTSRVFNVHPADLTILTGDNAGKLYVADMEPSQVAVLALINELKRKYKGEDAVYDAIVSGEKETRSTIHVVTEQFDEGPILVQSKAFAVPDKVRRWIQNRNFRPARRFADDLQDQMKLYGDGPAYLKALESTARGELGLKGKVAYDRGIALPYCGIRL